MVSDRKRKAPTRKIAVTTLSGFLGAGKTTLLKHILETKHKDTNAKDTNEKFRCAVIVNDMAELNIDKALVDSSSVLQSDEVISMQNGCICCSLKDDLQDQIVQLAAKQVFDYMIIEASGVSEPAEIASLFRECEEDHNHDEHHTDGDALALGEYAYLDTCVTVVDSNNFIDNFDEVRMNERNGSIAQLLVEQIEFANVVIANKSDLVSKEILGDVKQRIALLNPRAKLLEASNSRIHVADILDTKMYDADEMKVPPVQLESIEETKSCCLEKDSLGVERCCSTDKSRVLKSPFSEIILPAKNSDKTKHGKRFGISSFVYKARRPFHPERFEENFVKEFFIFLSDDELEADEDGDFCTEDPEKLKIQYEELRKKYDSLKAELESVKKGDHSNDVMEESVEDETDGMPGDQSGDENGFEQLKIRGAEKQAARYDKFQKLMRSKGYVWLANSHDIVQMMSQAGNMLSLEHYGPWNVLHPDSWSGSEEQQAENRATWSGLYGDRRQELVFIGVDLDYVNVQDILDECLLTDEEYKRGPDGWKASYGDVFLN